MGQPLYNRGELEYSFNVYIIDACGAGSSFITVTIVFLRNRHPPVFQVGTFSQRLEMHRKVFGSVSLTTTIWHYLFKKFIFVRV